MYLAYKTIDLVSLMSLCSVYNNRYMWQDIWVNKTWKENWLSLLNLAYFIWVHAAFKDWMINQWQSKFPATSQGLSVLQYLHILLALSCIHMHEINAARCQASNNKSINVWLITNISYWSIYPLVKHASCRH